MTAGCFNLLPPAFAQGGSGARQNRPYDPDRDHIKERNEWFYRGRIVRGLPTAELRRRAYQAKLKLRTQRWGRDSCLYGRASGEAQCIFNPPTPVTPGNSAVDVMMNLATKASARSQPSGVGQFPGPVIWLPIAAFVLGMSACETRKANSARRLLSAVGLCLGMIALMSCAGVSSARGGTGGPPPPPVTYHITVTGTSPGTPADSGQSTTVALVVN